MEEEKRKEDQMPEQREREMTRRITHEERMRRESEGEREWGKG